MRGKQRRPHVFLPDPPQRSLWLFFLFLVSIEFLVFAVVRVSRGPEGFAGVNIPVSSGITGPVTVAWTLSGGVEQTAQVTPGGGAVSLGTSGVTAEIRETPAGNGTIYDVRIRNRTATRYVHTKLEVRMPRSGTGQVTIGGITQAAPLKVRQSWQPPNAGLTGVKFGFFYDITSGTNVLRTEGPATSMTAAWVGTTDGIVRADGEAYGILEFWQRQPRSIEVTPTEVIFTLYNAQDSYASTFGAGEPLRNGEDVWDRFGIFLATSSDAEVVAGLKHLPNLSQAEKDILISRFEIAPFGLLNSDPEIGPLVNPLLQKYDRWQGTSWDKSYADQISGRQWPGETDAQRTTLFSDFAKGGPFGTDKPDYAWRDWGDIYWADGQSGGHYDWLRSAFKEYLKGGPGADVALEWAMSALRHRIAVDQIWANAGNGYTPWLERYEKNDHGEGAASDPNGKSTHTWIWGLLMGAQITQDPWVQEAMLHAAEGEWYANGGANVFRNDLGNGETRALGWPLLALTEAAKVTGDPKYWIKAKEVAANWVRLEARDGSLGWIKAWDRAYRQVGATSPFQYGYSSVGLIEFAEEATRRSDMPSGYMEMMGRTIRWLSTPMPDGPYFPPGTANAAGGWGGEGDWCPPPRSTNCPTANNYVFAAWSNQVFKDLFAWAAVRIDPGYTTLARQVFSDAMRYSINYSTGLIGYLTPNFPGTETKLLGREQLIGDYAARWLAGLDTLPLPPPPAPFIRELVPSSMTNDVARQVRISGDHFESGAAIIVFVGGVPAPYPANLTRYIDPAAVDITVPAGVTPATYDVAVFNPISQLASGQVPFEVLAAPPQPDTEPPVVSITSPFPNAVLSGSVTLRATATDNVGVLGVQFLVGGLNTGVEDTTPPYEITWDTLSQPNGAAEISARARDAAGNIGLAPAVPVSVANLPLAPTDLVAGAISQTEIQLSWVDNAANEDGFRLERSLSSTGGFMEVRVLPRDTEGFNDTGLAPATTYYYRVRAFNAAGASGYSNTAFAATPVPPPPLANPSNLIAIPLSPTQIRLNWTDNSGNELGFKVERRGPNETDFHEIVEVASNITQVTDGTLNPFTTYAYRVRAYNATGFSGYSNTANGTTFPQAPPPSPSPTPSPTPTSSPSRTPPGGGGGGSGPISTPTPSPSSSPSLSPRTTLASPSGLRAVFRAPSRIELAWTDTTSDEDGFEVERSVRGAGFEAVRTVARNSISLVLQEMLTGEVRFRIRGYRGIGAAVSYSGYSNIAAVTISSAPATPFTLSLRFGMRHEEVRRLQAFLNRDPGTRVAAIGAGSAGNETDFFGPGTRAAVVKFQEQYAQEILAPLGLTRGTGLWGPATIRKANALLGAPATPASLPPAPGVITRSLFPGLRDAQVRMLQQILNRDPDTQVAASGLGSPGQESDFYGSLTVDAVQRYQRKNGILNSGTPETGYGVVGPRTRAALNR